MPEISRFFGIVINLIVLQLLRRHQRLRESPYMLDPVVPDPDGFGSQIGVTECEQAGFVNRLAGRLALTRDDWPRRLAKTTGEGLTAYRDLA